MSALRKLRSLSHSIAFWSGLGRHAERGPSAVVLAFHGTPAHTARSLEALLARLTHRFTVVHLRDLLAGPLPAGAPPRCALTFDDGLRNQVSIAYPILRRLGVPATFFVCPGLIERGAWLWTHEMRQRLRHAAAAVRERLAAAVAAPADVEAFVQQMKRLPLDARRRVEVEIRRATPRFTPSESERDAFDIAGWDELRALDPALVTIGSHSLTHPILPQLGDAELEIELGESRRLLEERLQRNADLFAYPNGDYSDRVVESARRHYRAAVTVNKAWLWPVSDPFVLPRVVAPAGPMRLGVALHRGFEASRSWARGRASVVGAPV